MYIQPTNLDAFSLSTTVRNIPNRICETASKLEKKFLKSAVVDHVFSNMQNVVISRCCFVKKGNEMNRIMLPSPTQPLYLLPLPWRFAY